MELVRIGLYAILSIVGAIVLTPLVVKTATNAKQPILHYVDNHNGKAGTPTMGGLIFVFAACLVIIVSNGVSSMAFVAAIVTIGFGMIGFLDDFLKVKTKNNKGLKAYQKLLAQTAIAVAVALYCYFNPHISTVFKIPFSANTVDLRGWAIPVYIFVLVSMVNAVNLTDGLDGLVATTGSIFFTAITVILFIITSRGIGNIGAGGVTSLAYFSAAFAGSLIAFIVINSFPAKIFMGDTGSLAIGAGMACAAMFSGNTFYIVIIGIVYVISALSVAIQVIVFKLTKKRVFLMAPLHHHFERRGIHENKIVAGYALVTVIAAIVAVIFYA